MVGTTDTNDFDSFDDGFEFDDPEEIQDADTEPVGGASSSTSWWATMPLDFVWESPPAPVECQSDPELWTPEVGEMTPEQREHFKTVDMPRAQIACQSCYFRINCATNALDGRAVAGIYAGVQARTVGNPDSMHRRKLLKILAEYEANPPAGEESWHYEMLCARIADMLRRRTELRDGYNKALQATFDEIEREEAIRERKRARRAARTARRRSRRRDGQSVAATVAPELDVVAQSASAYIPVQLELALGA
ncbi:Uncharacterised protein [Mycobacteroides abscessus subsp. bolletii]|uniref:WhiB family transcriptional regulator n=1 Tax=Mycobacteroides abscessus TaxID=36809 RepID=UPI0009CC00C4|nr:WhiB family transcriptional regulator [Mycobacteroides abscessus]SKZ03197.1 Uncharacterised protein [Mycobacteroides abscessus subsp. bolletii]